MNRVVITGMGAVTPVGNSVDEMWRHVVNGVSGVGSITAFDASAYDTRIAAEVKCFELPEVDPKSVRRMDRFVQFAMKAAAEAVADSGLNTEEVDPARFGCIVGSGIGGLRVIEDQHAVLMRSGPSRVSPFLIPMLISDMAAGQIAIRYGARGPNFSTVSACASGAHALAVALYLLRAGTCDVILAGGTEASITPLGLAGFCSMKALSTRNDEPQRASRPFDRNRDGFVMGEGAGIVVLETLAHAQRRHARIIAEFAGSGMSCDAYHMTAPDPEGAGAALCMQYAIDDAGIPASSVDCINAHGTSTPLNDRAETAAIKAVFGAHARRLSVTSTKSMIGHLLGASGAVEFIVSCLTLINDTIPPTINYEDPDPDCDLDYVPNTSRRQTVNTVLSNSFGFGGHNISLLVRKFLP